MFVSARRLMLGTTIRAFVKSLVELIATVAASDFDYDFLFRHFLPNYLLLGIKRLSALRHISPRSKCSNDQQSNNDDQDYSYREENEGESNHSHHCVHTDELLLKF